MHTELLDNLQQLSSQDNFKLDSNNEGVIAGVKRGGGGGKAFRRGLHREMQLMEGRSVFVGMKWLICMHDVLQQCHQASAIELVQQLLPNFKLAKPTDSFQKYLQNVLLTPYLKYLIKFSHLSQLRQENSTSTADQELTYLEFNLLSFTVVEFATPIREFTRFLKTVYPCLSRYRERMAADASSMFRNIHTIYEANQLDSVRFLEVERLGTSLELLNFKREDDMEKTDDSNELVHVLMTTSYSPIKNISKIVIEDLELTSLPLNA